MVDPRTLPDARRALWSARDGAELVREAGFALLFAHQRPVEAGQIAEVTGFSLPAVLTLLETLAAAGGVDRDADGRLTGSAGLSLDTGPHHLSLRGRSFGTWCAYDALGIAAALGDEARIDTTCGVCQQAITVDVVGGAPDRACPERLWLADRGTDLRVDFCSPTVLLCGAEHAAAWATGQGGRGALLDLEAAAAAGRRDWASCAATGHRVLGTHAAAPAGPP